MTFKYRARDAGAWDRRANQMGGEFEGFIKDDLKVFSPKKGSNAVRLLPPTFDDASHYGIDVYVHYGVGPNNASVLCIQQMRNQRCPICEARNKALKVGDEEQARELKATKRVLVWMLDRNDDERGTMLWSMPYTLDRTISSLAKDKRTGKVYQLDDPDNGYDVFFDKVGEKMRTEYTGVQIDRNPSEVEESVLNYIEERPLPECLVWRNYDEVMRLYSGGEDPQEVAPPPRSRTNGNGHAEDPAPRRRVQPVGDDPEPEPRPIQRRRVEATESPQQTRREEINTDVPWDEEKPSIDENSVQEPSPAKSTAERLRQRYANRGGE